MDDSNGAPGPAILLIVLVLAVVLQPIVPLRRRQRGFDAFPWLTALLVFINVVCFFLTDMGSREEPIYRFGLTAAPFRFWTLLTHQFLHGGIEHLAGNMAGLWLIGPHLEEGLGRKRYLIYYLGAGLSGGLLQLLIGLWGSESQARIPLIGASGAIFGLLGVFAIRFWRTKVRLFVVFFIPAIWAVVLFAGLQLWSGIAEIGSTGGGVGYWAHVGGFAFGCGLAVATQVKDESRREYGIEDAEKALKERRYEDALSHYEMLLLDQPDDPGLHHTAALLSRQLGQLARARQHYEDSAVLYAKAGPPDALVRVFYDAREAVPDLALAAPVLVKIATACEQTRQFQLAYVALSEVALTSSESPEAEMALLRLGRLLLEQLREPGQAIPVFREFLRRYPASNMAHHAKRHLAEAERAAVS